MIHLIEPLPSESDYMLHTFKCKSCGDVASFKFLKG